MTKPGTFVCEVCGRSRKLRWRNVCPACHLVMDDFCAMTHSEKEHANEQSGGNYRRFQPIPAEEETS